MTSVFHGDWSPFAQMRWFEVQNADNVDMDPFSVVEISAAPTAAAIAEGRLVHQVRLPTEDSRVDTFVLGPMGIKVGQYGAATDSPIVLAKITGTQPSIGDQIGTKSGSDALQINYTGWYYHGAVTGTVGRVMRAGGGQGAPKIRFTIVTASPAASPPSAVVNIQARSCALTAVPGESGGQVTVYDRCGCYLDEPAGDLVGRCGYADYMLEDQASSCEWQITALCCNEC